MGHGQLAAKVKAVVDEAEKLRKSYGKECDEEWRAWAAKSLEGGARAAHAFTRLPPAAELRGATARGSPRGARAGRVEGCVVVPRGQGAGEASRLRRVDGAAEDEYWTSTASS
eukprot:2675420-Pyramimonas_sp.AAC.1